MRVENKAFLKSRCRVGRCEWCGKKGINLCAAHVFSKGAGRIDHPLNCVDVGLEPWDCPCHVESHQLGYPGKDEFLTVIAAREQELQPDIETTIHLIRHLPKIGMCREWDVKHAFKIFEANQGVERMTWRILNESGVVL